MNSTNTTAQAEQTPSIVLSKECLRSLDEHDRGLQIYSVHSYVVILVRANGDRSIISPELATLELARAYLAPLIEQFPSSHIIQSETWFTSEFEHGRQELLAAIVHDDAMSPPVNAFYTAKQNQRA